MFSFPGLPEAHETCETIVFVVVLRKTQQIQIEMYPGRIDFSRPSFIDSSGLPDLYEGISNLPIAYTPAIKKVASKRPAFKPGEKSRYNQTEFLLLRMVIERISAKPFEAFMADRIFNPLRMKTAQFADAKDIIPNKATLYSRYIPDASRFEFVNQNGDGVLSDRQMWIVPSLYPESVRAGAGLVMNALDLARFDAASGSLLCRVDGRRHSDRPHLQARAAGRTLNLARKYLRNLVAPGPDVPTTRKQYEDAEAQYSRRQTGFL